MSRIRDLSGLRRTAPCALLLLASASGATGQGVAPAFTLPEPTGPYAVGRMFVDWTDEGRVDPLAPTAGMRRSLPVTIWYPAPPEAAEGAATNYFPTPLRENFPADVSQIFTHAVDGAPLAGDQPQFPVVILKAAFGFLVLQHSALAEDLASHGYVVVGSDSPYTTPLVIYQDGHTVARTDSGAGRSAEISPNPLAPAEQNGATLIPFGMWVGDNSFVLDQLEMLDAEGGQFAGRLELDGIGAFGHSYGGAAALEFCRTDSRCEAAVDIDGAVMGEVVSSGLSAPSMFIWSDRPVFRFSDTERPADARPLLEAIDLIQAGLPNTPTQVILEGSGHFNFTDAALYPDIEAARQGGALGPIDPLLAIRGTNELLRTFFDAHLKAVPGRSVADVAASHPEMRVE